jgi:adenine-specific DNA-methyltransferase
MVFENGILINDVTLEGSFPYRHQMEKFLQGQETFDTKGQKWLEVYFKKGGNPYYKKQRNSVILGSVLKDLPNSGFSDLKKLNLEEFFENPKPVALIDVLLRYFTDKTQESIVLDFFSGSATTAHAVMQLNSEDDGKRKFIMVQLPEETDEKSEARKAGYDNICEISKERIRRAGKKIVDMRHCEEGKTRRSNPAQIDCFADARNDEMKLDIGFRVLKLDSTNMNPVFYNPNDVKQGEIAGLQDNIKDDRTSEDLLFQVMLDMGVDLSNPITNYELRITNKTYNIFIVGENVEGISPNLMCCFDESITKEVVTEIAKRKPLYAVFRDSGFERDDTMVSFDQIFEAFSPTTERRVI